MLSTIVVPLDGSALAEQALSYATRIAKSAGAKLLLVRAPVGVPESSAPDSRPSVPTPAGAFLDELDARSELARIASRLEVGGLEVETHVHTGEAAAVILDVARNRHAELIVMSTHGRGGFGRWLYGSVADQILRQSPVPVLLATAACSPPWPEDRRLRIVVPLDGSPMAEAALGTIGDFAALVGADLLLLRVVEPAPRGVSAQAPHVAETYLQTELSESLGYLRLIANGLMSRGLAAAARTVVGYPPLAIASITKEQGADIIAMATHGSGGLSRLIAGSVATETLQRASVPLLLIRPAVAGQREAAVAMLEPTPIEKTAIPAVDVRLNQYELDLLLRGLGEILYAPDRDVRLVEPARELRMRLKHVEAELFQPNDGRAVRD
ncbi:MAG: universal stress protein [Chloroflexota bacterium]|nr:MAG: universal stress protein [Chloroflexota bacterium]